MYFLFMLFIYKHIYHIYIYIYDFIYTMILCINITYREISKYCFFKWLKHNVTM